MATQKQIPVLAGAITSAQEGFKELSNDDMQWAILNPDKVVQLSVEAIKNRHKIATWETKKMPVLSEQIKMWGEIYETYFGLKDRKSLKPEYPMIYPGMNWLIVVQKGLTLDRVVEALRTKMRVTCYILGGSHLDNSVPTNERKVDEDYAILVRDRVEADEELRDTSADQVAEKNISTMTLLERLLLELFYFHFIGEHLDVSHYTLCSGSRTQDGTVPVVYWHSGNTGVVIGYYEAYNSDNKKAARLVKGV